MACFFSFVFIVQSWGKAWCALGCAGSRRHDLSLEIKPGPPAEILLMAEPVDVLSRLLIQDIKVLKDAKECSRMLGKPQAQCCLILILVVLLAVVKWHRMGLATIARALNVVMPQLPGFFSSSNTGRQMMSYFRNLSVQFYAVGICWHS